VLLSFNRVRDISSDEAVIRDVCAHSTALELSPDGKKVRRAAPWPEHDTSRPRTIFARSVPPSASLDQLLAFFGAFGLVNAVRFRRKKEGKERKDSVFVEFASEQTAAKVVALQKASLSPGVDVLFQTAQSHWQENLAKRKRKEAEAAPAKKRADPARAFEPGSIVHFSGIGTGLSRQALKEVFEQHVSVPGSVKFVDYNNGASEGYVRLDNEIIASFMTEKMRGAKALVDGKEPVLRVLAEGNEFDEYMQKLTLLDELKKGPANKKQKGKKQQQQQKKSKQKKPKDRQKKKEGAGGGEGGAAKVETPK
jgi:hypothetical protein